MLWPTNSIHMTNCPYGYLLSFGILFTQLLPHHLSHLPSIAKVHAARPNYLIYRLNSVSHHVAAADESEQSSLERRNVVIIIISVQLTFFLAFVFVLHWLWLLYTDLANSMDAVLQFIGLVNWLIIFMVTPRCERVHYISVACISITFWFAVSTLGLGNHQKCAKTAQIATDQECMYKFIYFGRSHHRQATRRHIANVAVVQREKRTCDSHA